jgi:hypothetical protein
LHERGAELIRAAFERARKSGASEWQTMTPAVLKNRLLDATNRTFDESDWNASSFAEFLEQFDDVVDSVPYSRPPQIKLVQDESSSAPQEIRDIGSRRRIRPDLWDAILDYSSDLRYFWDGTRAVKIAPGEVSAGVELPTLDKSEFSEWRREFVRREGAKHPPARVRLVSWLEKDQPLVALPRPLRTSWVVELKMRVVGRLEDWFQAKGIAPPDDLVYDDELAESPDADPLRERVLAAVRAMTREELETLQLPATVLMRIKG